MASFMQKVVQARREVEAGCSTSHSATAGKGSEVTVHFRVVAAWTRPGDSLSIVGSPKDLGAWSPCDGLMLQTGPETFPIWEGSVALDLGHQDTIAFEYKAVLIRPGECHWESNQNRTPTIKLQLQGQPAKEDWLLATEWQGLDATPQCLASSPQMRRERAGRNLSLDDLLLQEEQEQREQQEQQKHRKSSRRPARLPTVHEAEEEEEEEEEEKKEKKEKKEVLQEAPRFHTILEEMRCTWQEQSAHKCLHGCSSGCKQVCLRQSPASCRSPTRCRNFSLWYETNLVSPAVQEEP